MRLPGFLHRGDGHRPHHPVRNGIIFAVVVLVGFSVAIEKHRLLTAAHSGQTIRADFSRQYLLRPFLTQVKVAGVNVGSVTGVKQTATGAEVALKVYSPNASKLGTAPTAAIRLNTLLGGLTYVELTPGGSPGSPQGTIPVSRTRVPTYVDNIQSSVTPPAQQGFKKFINQTDLTLTHGGQFSAEQVFLNAPGALVPSGQVLNALQGQQPGDLTDMIANESQTDTVLTRQDGQVEAVVNGLGTFARSLGNQSQSLEETVRNLPAQEQQTQAGLTALDSILNELNLTAGVARPTVQQLSQLIIQTRPTLVDAKPVLAALNPFLAESAPLFQQLVPTSIYTTSILNDVRGPVLDRLNGPAPTTGPNGHTIEPILPQLLAENCAVSSSTCTASPAAPGDKTNGILQPTPATAYQELGYVIAGFDSSTSFYEPFNSASQGNPPGHLPFVILGQNTHENFLPNNSGTDGSDPNIRTGQPCGGSTYTSGFSTSTSGTNNCVGSGDPNGAPQGPAVLAP